MSAAPGTNVIPFPNTALARAVARWQAQAWGILGNPESPPTLRHLALRFLQAHGLM